MLKKRGLGQFADLNGGLARKKEAVFLRGLIPQCTLCTQNLVISAKSTLKLVKIYSTVYIYQFVLFYITQKGYLHLNIKR